MVRSTLQSALCLCLASMLVAQQTAVAQSAKSPQQSAIPDVVIIPKGTRIELASLENVSSATAKENSVVRFALAKDLVVNEVTLLYAGTLVEGKVSHVRRGVPHRQWGTLTITIKKIQIGTHSHLRLTSRNPEPSGSKVDEYAMCALVFPLCIAMIIAFIPGSREKPPADAGQALLPPCVKSTFWTGSTFKISDQDIAEEKAALPASYRATCTDPSEKQSRGQVRIR